MVRGGFTVVPLSGKPALVADLPSDTLAEGADSVLSLTGAVYVRRQGGRANRGTANGVGAPCVDYSASTAPTARRLDHTAEPE
jgi:hypothetical protein